MTKSSKSILVLSTVALLTVPLSAQAVIITHPEYPPNTQQNIPAPYMYGAPVNNDGERYYVQPTNYPGTANIPETGPETGYAPVWTGGVAETGEEAVRQREDNYSLKLIFSNRSAEYLADVGVNITDSKGGNAVAVMTDGPILLAALPAGRYTVTSDYQGHVIKKNVRIGRGLKSIDVQFPVRDEDEAPNQ